MRRFKKGDKVLVECVVDGDIPDEGGEVEVEHDCYQFWSKPELIHPLNNWVAVEDGLPEEDGHYLVTTGSFVDISYFKKDTGYKWCSPQPVDYIAWQPLPSPYVPPVRGQVKPPLGVKPKKLHDEQRLQELEDTVIRYSVSEKEIPIEWLGEQLELQESLKPKLRESCEGCQYVKEWETGVCGSGCMSAVCLKTKRVDAMPQRINGKPCHEV